MRILHAADLHIDSQIRGISDALADQADADLIAGATRTAFANLVDLAVDERVDAVLVAGDVFDGDWTADSTRRVFVAAATRLHDEGIPLLMVGGNHDATSELVRRMRLPESAHVFRTDVATTYRVPGLDLAVHGQGFATQAVTANLARAYPDADPGLVNVGLLHANVGASSGHNNYAPCTEDDLVRLGYDYMALGHIHARRTFEHDGRVVAAYAGNPQGRSARELEAKGAYLVTLAPGAAPVLDFRALDVLRWHTIDVDTEGLDAVDGLFSRIADQHQALRATADGRHLVVRVRVGVSPELAGGLPHRDELREQVRDVLAGSLVEKVTVRLAGPTEGVDHGDLAAEIAAAARDLQVATLAASLADVREEVRRQLTPLGIRLDDEDYLAARTQEAVDELRIALSGRP